MSCIPRGQIVRGHLSMGSRPEQAWVLDGEDIDSARTTQRRRHRDDEQLLLPETGGSVEGMSAYMQSLEMGDEWARVVEVVGRGAGRWPSPPRRCTMTVTISTPDFCSPDTAHVPCCRASTP